MSDINPMEQAAGQAATTAAVALQVLIMTARALREHQQREAAQAAQNQTQQPQPPAQVQQTAPANPDHARYAQLVRGTMQPPAVAEAMVTSAGWPQLADELKKLEVSGVHVGQFLTDAAPVIARMDADLRAGSPTPGVTARPSAAADFNPFAAPPGEGPEREGPGLLKQLAQWVKETAQKLWDKVTGKGGSALGDRSGDLARHGISPQENTRLVVIAREALADEGLLGRLVTSREWPGIAAQMRDLHQAGHNPREALAAIPLRIRQAVDAGITLTPAEAARGLLGDQVKTPAAAPTTPPPATVATAPAATPASGASVVAQAPPSPAARAAAATAQSTTATPGATPEPGPQAARTAPAPAPAPSRTHGR